MNLQGCSATWISQQLRNPTYSIFLPRRQGMTHEVSLRIWKCALSQRRGHGAIFQRHKAARASECGFRTLCPSQLTSDKANRDKNWRESGEGRWGEPFATGESEAKITVPPGMLMTDFTPDPWTRSGPTLIWSWRERTCLLTAACCTEAAVLFSLLPHLSHFSFSSSFFLHSLFIICTYICVSIWIWICIYRHVLLKSTSTFWWMCPCHYGVQTTHRGPTQTKMATTSPNTSILLGHRCICSPL